MYWDAKFPIPDGSDAKTLIMSWTEVDADGDTGYILEVDLQYPAILHDQHMDYP